MDFAKLVEIVKMYAPMSGQYVLMGLGALVVLGRAYVMMTPSKDDDQWLQKLEDKAGVGHMLKMLVAFSPVQRKDEAK